jgi:hypothetical protein
VVFEVQLRISYCSGNGGALNGHKQKKNVSPNFKILIIMWKITDSKAWDDVPLILQTTVICQLVQYLITIQFQFHV